MNPEKILPDDPRLTTYALGEMDPAEVSTFEQLLQHDTEARAAVEAIRSTALALGTALENEAHPAPVAPLDQAAILAGGDLRKLDGGSKPTPAGQLAKIIRFPQLYFVVSTAAAACFAVFFVYWSREQEAREASIRHYVQLNADAVDALKKAEGEMKAKVRLAERERDEAAAARVAAASPAAAPAPAATPAPTSIASGSVSLPQPLSSVAVALPPAEPEQALARASGTDLTFETPRIDEQTPPPPPAPIEARQAPTVGSGYIAAQSGGRPTFGASNAPAGISFEGQNSPTVASAQAQAINEQPIQLSAFQVTSNRDQGSVSASTVAAANGKDDWSTSRRNKPKTMANVSYNSLTAPFGDVRMRQVNKVTLKEQAANTEAYAPLIENPFVAVAQNALSTFSIDVDTAAYANLRRFLKDGQRPPRDAMRIEELVNYFPYRYAAPKDQTPFAASMEVANAPWTPEHRLVRIGLKGREVTDAARPKANLVFLLDVSGSMNSPNKLPLVKQSLAMLVNKLRPDDRVAIVVYAGASGMALPSTTVREQAKIIAAIDQLEPEGSTNGAAGIQLAYDIAKANFVTGGVNRVILATDGDFNVGTTSESELTELITEKAKSGVFLTVLGFGMGNYKDSTLEKLADKGNGNYAYIDTAAEARKALVEQAGGTLVTIAKDVKIQVEFNPTQVRAYRLLGYENRVLRNEDFNNDKVDAGEIGAGHTVTALYELVPVGATMPETGSVDALKYQKVEAKPATAYAASDELLTLKVRYKDPAGDVSKKLEFPLRDSDHSFEQASADFKFAASVAAFGMILRDSPHKGAATLADVTTWAQSGIEDDAGGYRSEFVELIHAAEAIVR